MRIVQIHVNVPLGEITVRRDYGTQIVESKITSALKRQTTRPGPALLPQALRMLADSIEAEQGPAPGPKRAA